jgi:hypothetical protein
MTRPVLEVRVDVAGLSPTLTSFCPGYEQGRWRATELARDVFDRHLTSFALPYSEYNEINHDNAAASLRKAAESIYKTDKYSKRGEFGELLLHAIVRDLYGSQPAISKIYFKDSANDTVKGFDAVHVVEIDEELELWLGEVKFYSDLDRAIRDVTNELIEHLAAGYLRGEFVAITNKLDPDWVHSERVSRLLHQNTSLDEIFDSVTIPVLLTYDSGAVQSNSRVSIEYIEELEKEARAGWDKFCKRCDDTWSIKLRLLLLPMKHKDDLVLEMQQRLRAWQHI